MKNLLISVAALCLFVSCSTPTVSHLRFDDDPVRSGNDTVSFVYPVGKLAKGSEVDFMATAAQRDSTAGEHWNFEYFDGKAWQKSPSDIHVLNFRGGHNSVISKSFTIAKTITDSLRVRLVAKDGKGGTIIFAPLPEIGHRICTYTGYPKTSSARVGCIGNSFTYFYGAAFLLEEIARCEGLDLDLVVSVKGGQYFRQHINLPLTQEMMAKGGYEYVFLQDQSCQHARFYTDSLQSVATETKALADEILKYSPEAKIMLEATWAYEGSENWQGYGSFEAFDEAIQGGGEAIAEMYGYSCSPIGRAFALAREKGIDLYYNDNKHQGLNGAYLKACVNYLMLTGKRFDDNAPDCGIDPETASLLRETAEQTVL